MSGKPKRIQRKRTRGWKMPPNTVYVGRPTKWGNPFVHPIPGEAVNAFRSLMTDTWMEVRIGPDAFQFATNSHRDCLHWWFPSMLRESLGELAGKDLACWCPLDRPCHADVLLELANRGAE